MITIPNVATADGYTNACTLGPIAETVAIKYVVANASVLAQVTPQAKDGTLEDFSTQEEILITPETNMVQKCTGIRFRSAVAGAPAQVVAQLYLPADAQFASGTPFAGQLSASGGVGSAVQIPVVLLANFPPASPADQQVVELQLPGSYDPIGGFQFRWLCSYDLAGGLWHVQGAGLYAEVQTAEAPGAGVYADFATAGPSVTIPRGGTYQVEYGASIELNSGGQSVFVSPSYGGAGPADADRIELSDDGTSWTQASLARVRVKTGFTLAAGTVVKLQGKGVTGVPPVALRWLRVSPVRIA